MFEMLSTILKYFFILVIYMFIFSIIRLIYLDIRSLDAQAKAKRNMPYLKLVNRREQFGFKVEENYALDKDITLGRTGKSQIVIMDPFISGRHARFFIREGKYFIADLGSTNGTFINGKELRNETVEINDGDRLNIGQMDFLFVDTLK